MKEWQNNLVKAIFSGECDEMTVAQIKEKFEPKTMTITIEVPTTCGSCRFYSEGQYQCHNERGSEAHCSMGYMQGEDMRDKSYRGRKYEKCKLGQ